MQGIKFSPAVGSAISIPTGSTTGTGTAIAMHDCRQISGHVTGVGTVTGGVVVFESAASATYSGTWSQIDSLDFSVTSLTDSTYQNTWPGGQGGFYRWRITSAITGGGTIGATVNGLLQ